MVSLVRQKANKKLSERNREPCRMHLQTILFAASNVAAVAFGIGKRQNIWGDSTTIISEE